jgi:hypothetical protein
MGNSFFKFGNEQVMEQNISWSFDETRNVLSKSPFIHVSNEIVLHIFQFLSVRDLCNISLVCRSFKLIADHDQLWKLKCNSK